MCNCKHFEVSTKPDENGIVIQECTNCHKQIEMPGTMTAMMRWIENHPTHKNRTEFIKMYYSRVL